MNLTHNAWGPGDWDISLDAWIIQDGSYPDFHVGQTARFAVEFWIPADARVELASADLNAVPEKDALYNVVADVVLRTEAITILDLGILAYCETESLKFQLVPDARYSLQLGLGVDPFFYFEILNRIAGVPPLIYTWQIRSILRLGPGQHRSAMEATIATNAWTDDEGLAEYILRCERLNVEPKRSFL